MNPRVDNLNDIVNLLADADAYQRRRIAQSILKGFASAEVTNHHYDDQDMNDYKDHSEHGGQSINNII